MSTSIPKIEQTKTSGLPGENSECLVNSLPHEILQLIFNWLTEKEALIAAIVCKHWRAQINETPAFKTGRLFKVIKEYYKLEKELTFEREFHLNPICPVRQSVTSIRAITDSGLIVLREGDVGGEHVLYSNQARNYYGYKFAGSCKNKSFFCDTDSIGILICDLGSGETKSIINIYNVPEGQESLKKPNINCFQILECFVLPTKEILIITTGGVIEIWDVSEDQPQLKFHDYHLSASNDPNTVIAASLFGSHLIIICPDSKKTLYDFDTEKKSLVAIEIEFKIPVSKRRNIFSTTIADRCIVQIAEELICFKEHEGDIKVQWVKPEFDLILGHSTLKHQNGTCFAASKIGGQLKRTVLFDPENGNALSEIHNVTTENPIFFRDYCITFHSQQIFFRSLAGNSIGESSGYSLVLPEELKGLKFELLDVAMTKNRLLLLADIGDLEKKKRMIFELISQEKKIEETEENLESSGSFGSDSEDYVFSNDDTEETSLNEVEERSAERSLFRSETPEVETNADSILPIAPFAERLEAREINNDVDGFLFADSCWETARVVSNIVLCLLSICLMTGAALSFSFGMVNLSWGLAASSVATALLWTATCYCKT